MKQKIRVSVIGALVVIIGAVALMTGCPQPNSNKNTDNDWYSVSNKSDLVGTWKADFSKSGVVGKKTLSIASDFSGYLQHEDDYTGADASYVASLDEAVSNMENVGYTVTHNKANKTIIAKLNFTSEVLEEMLSFLPPFCLSSARHHTGQPNYRLTCICVFA